MELDAGPALCQPCAPLLSFHPGSERICKFIGDISYPLYITHQPLIFLLWAWIGANPGMPLGYIVPMCIGLAIIQILFAYGMLKAIDIPVRAWLTEHWLKREKKMEK